MYSPSLVTSTPMLNLLIRWEVKAAGTRQGAHGIAATWEHRLRADAVIEVRARERLEWQDEKN